MIRKFNVRVNNKAYEVEVEEIAVSAKQEQYVAPVTHAAAPAVTVKGDGTELKAPMPGMLLKLVAANGAKVNKNDVVLILEAMKMENEIRANASGTITFAVEKGKTVKTGDVLAYIK